jgi:hypothetical protein
MVTGGVATVLYGDPRFTRDIDLVLNLEAPGIGNLEAAFGGRGFYGSRSQSSSPPGNARSLVPQLLPEEATVNLRQRLPPLEPSPVRKVASVALAMFLVVAPEPLEGQVSKRFCNSPALNWCFNVITMDYLESVRGNGISDYTFTATAFLSGPTFAALPVVQWGVAVFPSGFLGGYATRILLPPETTVTRQMTATASSGFAPSDSDWRFYWDDEAANPPVYSSGLCGGGGPPPAGNSAACYVVSVPEPDSWALVLTGIFGLALVGWERRKSPVA